MTEPAPRKSDLGVRVVSAVVMVAVAGAALWLGGWVWTAFVVIVALAVLLEWRGLVAAFARTTPSRSIWLLGGLAYIGLAALILVELRDEPEPSSLLTIIVAVVATDIGAYFAGRTIGGPKIAPTISPSKTWAGLIGGAIGAAVAVYGVAWVWQHGLCHLLLQPGDPYRGPVTVPEGQAPQNVLPFDGLCSGVFYPWGYSFTDSLVFGLVIAVVAQFGDFFESWMKRRAGVKDSGSIIPGHGGLFDRADGLIAVCFVTGVAWLVGQLVR